MIKREIDLLILAYVRESFYYMWRIMLTLKVIQLELVFTEHLRLQELPIHCVRAQMSLNNKRMGYGGRKKKLFIY